MSTLGNKARLALGLAAALVLAGGCAASTFGGESDPPVGEPIGDAAQAFTVPCTNAGGTTAGALEVQFIGPGVASCYRLNPIPSGASQPPPPAPGLPSCWQLAKSFGCIGF